MRPAPYKNIREFIVFLLVFDFGGIFWSTYDITEAREIFKKLPEAHGLHPDLI